MMLVTLVSMRTVSVVSSQCCRIVDADVWCKRGLRVRSHETKAKYRISALKLSSCLSFSANKSFTFVVKNSKFDDGNRILFDLFKQKVNKNAFQHCVAPKPFVTQANFKTFAWITGKKLKSQVNQSNSKKFHEPPGVNN